MAIMDRITARELYDLCRKKRVKMPSSEIVYIKKKGSCEIAVKDWNEQFAPHAYSTEDLLEWLPKIILARICSGDHYFTKYIWFNPINDRWCCAYKAEIPYKESIDLVTFIDERLNDAVARMVIWCVENGYIK